MNANAVNDTELKEGGELAEKFCLRPKNYAGTTVALRLKINEKWSGWKIRKDILSQLQLEAGETIATRVFLYNTAGLTDDVNNIDLFASKEGADWLIDNKVSKGDLVDCEVQFSYVDIPSSPIASESVLIPKVSLIFMRGISVAHKVEEAPTDKATSSEDILSGIIQALGAHSAN